MSLLSGQFTLAANVVYTMASVPLALCYLSKTEFGMWAVVLQFVGYLALIDSGMSFSFSRLLIDHKDTRENGKYGAMIKLAFAVSSTQGVIILLLGITVSLTAAVFLEIPAELRPDFYWLFIGQCALTMLQFCTRGWGYVLFAHQRMDVGNYVGVAQLLVALVLLLVFFECGAGLFAMLYANAAAFALTMWIPVWVCYRQRYMPAWSEYGKINWELAREAVRYGMDVFLVILGSQLTLTSQTLLVGWVMGMEAAAVWVIMTKPFNFVAQIVWRIFHYAAPALSEMYVRREKERFKKSVRDIVVLTGYLAALSAAGLAVCNSDFIRLWTNGKIYWQWHDDWLLGTWFLMLSIVYCYCGVLTQIKQIGKLKYIYLLEGAVFIGSVLWWPGCMEFGVLLGMSIVSGMVFSGVYCVVRTGQLLPASGRELARWSAGAIAMFVVLAMVGVLAGHILPGTWPLARLIVSALLIAGIGGWIVCRHGITPEHAAQLPLFAWRIVCFCQGICRRHSNH